MTCRTVSTYNLPMINRLQLVTVAPRVTIKSTLPIVRRIEKRAAARRVKATPRHLGAVFNDAGEVIGQNVGTQVRPEIVRVVGTFTGVETVEQFLARGGRVTVGAPKIAKGAALVNTIKSGSTRVVVSRG